MTFVKTSVFNPQRKDISTGNNYPKLIDYLLENYHNGFDMPTDIYVNGIFVEVDRYDMELSMCDVVVLIERPQAPVAISFLVQALITTALSYALSYAINKIFAPDVAEIEDQTTPSTVYALNNSQNTSKLGGVIPVVYGTVRMYPSLIAQPYYRYDENNNEYMYQLMCVGHGLFTLDELLIDTQNMDNSTDIEYQLLTHSDFADIETATGDSHYVQLTSTLSTPSNLKVGGFRASDVPCVLVASTSTITAQQELDLDVGDEFIITGGTLYQLCTVQSVTVSINQTIIVCSNSIPDVTGDFSLYTRYSSNFFEISADAISIEVDYTYPRGLYNSNDNGAYSELSDILYIDMFDSSYAYINRETVTTTASSNNPIRRSLKLARGQTRYIQIVWTGEYTDIKKTNTLYISRVKELYAQPNMTNIGDVTLMWAKLKATDSISSIGQTKVNGFFTRTDVSNNMKNVLEDIYTNQAYGARLSLSDLNFPTTGETVNGAFDNSHTVWDAMQQVAKAQKYSLFPIGQELILKKDEATTITTALFNETNIIKGTLKAQYYFKEENESSDSVECSYRDASDWSLQSEIYPSNGLYPQTIELFGVVSPTVALNVATYLYKQEQARRKVITFDTDIQGLVPQFLDKILISHSSLIWGEAGQVKSVDGSNVEVYDSVETSSNITFRDIDGIPSDTLAFVRVDDYNITVANIPNWVTSGTLYAIGNPREFLVTKVTPKGDTVTIECVNYTEEIYT